MPKKPRKYDFTPEQMIEAIDATKGRYYQTAQRLKCSVQTVYNYINKFPEVKTAFRNHKGLRLDKAEGILWKSVEKGESWAVCFYLKCQGKERGYIEKPPELPPLELLLASLPDDIRETVRAALAKSVHTSRTENAEPGG